MSYRLGQGFSSYHFTASLDLDIYAPFEEGGAYCVAHVGRYVGIP